MEPTTFHNTDLYGIANTVLRHAQLHGYVVRRDIRAALVQAGQAETHWKEVLDLVRPSLTCRHGRYYFVPAGTARMRARARHDQRQQRAIQHRMDRLIRQYLQEQVPVERREKARIELVRPVRALTEDQRVLSLVTRDLSVTGLRLLGTHRLQGQKIHVWIPRPEDDGRSTCFLVHILWSALVGDDLYECGGVFLDVLHELPEGLKIVRDGDH